MNGIDVDQQRSFGSYRSSPMSSVSIMAKNKHDGRIVLLSPSRRHCPEGEVAMRCSEGQSSEEVIATSYSDFLSLGVKSGRTNVLPNMHLPMYQPTNTALQQLKRR